MWGQHDLRESKTKKSPYVILKVTGKSPKNSKLLKTGQLFKRCGVFNWCLSILSDSLKLPVVEHFPKVKQ